jgi:hypothetical protein
VVAQPAKVPALPPFVPQFRYHRPSGARLSDAVYGMRPSEVLRRDGLYSSDRIRTDLGLEPPQRLMLLLFDKDEILERVWADAARVLDWLATAQFDLVVAPSYSKWTPRPRTEFLVAAKRSLATFQALQDVGVPAIPRLMWELDHDVQRAAVWLHDNPVVETVGLDLQTYRREKEWRDQLDGLALLDRLTGHRLRYVINGPTTIDRMADVFDAVTPRRVCLTNMTEGAVVEVCDEQLSFDGMESLWARAFDRKCVEMRRRVSEGRRLSCARRAERRRGSQRVAAA